MLCVLVNLVLQCYDAAGRIVVQYETKMLSYSLF